MTFVQNILEIAKEQKVNNQQLCKILKSNPNKIYDWKIGKSKPSIEEICILSDYFNVSIDYLLGRTDIKNSIQQPADIQQSAKTQQPLLNENEEEILRIFQSLSVRGKNELMLEAYKLEDIENENELAKDTGNHKAG